MHVVTLAPGVVYSTPRPLTAAEVALLCRAWERWGEAGAREALRLLTADAWAYAPGRFTIVRRRAA